MLYSRNAGARLSINRTLVDRWYIRALRAGAGILLLWDNKLCTHQTGTAVRNNSISTVRFVWLNHPLSHDLVGEEARALSGMWMLPHIHSRSSIASNATLLTPAERYT